LGAAFLAAVFLAAFFPLFLAAVFLGAFFEIFLEVFLATTFLGAAGAAAALRAIMKD
jgi:hypothetical protein